MIGSAQPGSSGDLGVWHRQWQVTLEAESFFAEVYAAGVPYAYVPRPRFRESDVLSVFVQEQMPGFAIDADELSDGRWVERIPDLLALPRRTGQQVNGAEQIAAFLERLF